MLRFYQDVDRPGLVLAQREFTEPVEIIGNQTYGRVLFRSHDIEIRDCRFRGGPGPLLTLSTPIHGGFICGNWFTANVIEGEEH